MKALTYWQRYRERRELLRRQAELKTAIEYSHNQIALHRNRLEELFREQDEVEARLDPHYVPIPAVIRKVVRGTDGRITKTLPIVLMHESPACAGVAVPLRTESRPTA
ncbi:hypothetical protein [Niveibacterium sp. SC-1]|uniref:hypothetical protein n=1 Tax=Niveibacterium sp. SC-1 TaxID=3135646 RepID=UPI00311F2680